MAVVRKDKHKSFNFTPTELTRIFSNVTIIVPPTTDNCYTIISILCKMLIEETGSNYPKGSLLFMHEGASREQLMIQMGL